MAPQRPAAPRQVTPAPAAGRCSAPVAATHTNSACMLPATACAARRVVLALKFATSRREPPPSVPRARARAQLGAEATAKADMDLLSLGETNIEEGEQSISRSGRRRRTKGGGAGDAGAGAEVELGGELIPGTAAAEALRAEMAAAAIARLVDAELDLLEAEAEVDAAAKAEHARGSSGTSARLNGEARRALNGMAVPAQEDTERASDNTSSSGAGNNMSSRLVSRVSSFGRRKPKPLRAAAADGPSTLPAAGADIGPIHQDSDAQSQPGCASDFLVTLKKSHLDGRLGLKLSGANLVTHVEPGGGAAASGLMLGDWVIRCDGVKLTSYAELLPLLGKMPHGGVKVVLRRAVSRPMGTKGSSPGASPDSHQSKLIAQENEELRRAVEEQGDTSRDVDLDLQPMASTFRAVQPASCTASQGGRIRRATSFERKLMGKRVTVLAEAPGGQLEVPAPPSEAPSAAPSAAPLQRLSRSLSFGRRPRSEVPPPAFASTLAEAPMEMPRGDVRIEGIVWKRFSNAPRYNRRYLFIQGGMLCYTDPKSSTGDNAIVYGPITAADITSANRYELSLFSNERQLLVRVGTKAELDAWYHMGQLVAKENFLSRTEH
eukprot:scaffold66413_cov60-Phaeocystis_antarctica.AAC.3